MKEKAALSLGHLCVGECFPHTTDVANKIIATVKEVHKYLLFCKFYMFIM